MKQRIFYIAVAILFVLHMASCSKENIHDSGHVAVESFRIYVPLLQTKTVNDGVHTKWVVGDRLNVHYAISGTTDYVDAGRFDISDAESGKAELFDGPLPVLDANATYDWYAFCRYNSNNTPVKTNGTVYVGCKYNGFQSQNGNNSMAHVFGANSTSNYFPLYGCVKGVSGSEFPTIIMKNVAALAEYKVTNSLDKGIIVTDITFEGSNALVGTVYVNYEQDEAVVTSNKTSNSSVLKVTNGSAIGTGSSACFYAGVIPGVQKSLSVTVNVKDADGNTGSQIFTLTPSEPVTFRSGKIKTLELNFSQSF